MKYVYSPNAWSKIYHLAKPGTGKSICGNISIGSVELREYGDTQGRASGVFCPLLTGKRPAGRTLCKKCAKLQPNQE